MNLLKQLCRPPWCCWKQGYVPRFTIAAVAYGRRAPRSLIQVRGKWQTSSDSTESERSFRRWVTGLSFVTGGAGLAFLTSRARARASRAYENAVLDHYPEATVVDNFGKRPLVVRVCMIIGRLCKVLFLFMPVGLCLPIIFLGKRLPGSWIFGRGVYVWLHLLVRQMERSGATFIKLGQWAALRTDMLPPILCRALCKLHSQGRPHGFPHTESVLLSSFGASRLQELFEVFENKPIGVGSIAQVYRAKLSPQYAPKKGSPWVVLKIVHPGVEEQMHIDLFFLRALASLINLVPTMKWLSLPQEVDEFATMLRKQTDLRCEANNLIRFQHNFNDRNYVLFPTVVKELTTKTVLVESYAEGIHLNRFLQAPGGPFDHTLACIGEDALFQMLIRDNFFHADLHPGNILVQLVKRGRRKRVSMYDTSKLKENCSPEEWHETMQMLYDKGYRPRMVFLDAGLVVRLGDEDRRNFLDLFKTVLNLDGYQAGRLMVERSRQPERAINTHVFALKMENLLIRVSRQTFSLQKVQLGSILQEVMTMTREHHVRVDPNFANVVLSILLVSGIGRILDPDLDLMSNATPYLRYASVKGATNFSTNNSWYVTLFFWLALELRDFVLLSTSKQTVENWVKADMISPSV
ncbi:atypical/ABC1/ABC1-C protein kinase [Schizosaccharomyces japonicus yFS275]|uniref:Atypical/ABC1/ABC1-C protein kinase n=1 Tax=Schizosaccharomyces japonicus (strain yFS275 / FY16936) TaxID=402676 RepID=B6JVS8_SCHJY|nr:atypical/ABC1/ABC1-C protein kinase [Schizosaccharomyces japonicus yFS275]EEB05479.1 atypical/ABC1/ABC1-C protein kinase [Schizosaccharomyces japonicus yFS275]